MLKKIIETKFANAFKEKFGESVLLDAIEVVKSTHPRFGHYQCNSAMKLTKQLKRPPRQIAEEIVSFLEENNTGEIEKYEVAGPGFINITLSAEFITQLSQQLENSLESVCTTEKPQRVVIDFSSPNTAKEMHVGHLRTTIIGDSIARLLEFLGHDVLRLNHIGDWGTAFGMLIAYIKKFEPQILTLEKSIDLSSLVSAYKAAKKLFDEDPLFKKQSQLEVVSLQQENPASIAAWKLICEISRKAYQEIYDLLDIKITERGESFYNPLLLPLIKDLEKKQLLTISDGAKCLFLEGFVNREGEPLPFILQKSDGGFNYSTTDLAALKHRIEIEKADRIIYVIDAGQSVHLAMLFKAAEVAGYLSSKIRVEHVPFGVVLGPDGKKFKTRSGETERLMDLLSNAIDKANEILIDRNKESENPLPLDEIAHIAKVLGINAIKYADLSGNRINDYTFSYDRMLRFEGNTAAFLMYAYVRIHGIKRRVLKNQPVVMLEKINLQHPSEIALGLHLCQFPEMLDSISEDLMLNRLCDYLFELAEKFNGFFRDCRVEGDPQQNQRLALCELSRHILKEGMGILGLKTVTKM